MQQLGAAGNQAMSQIANGGSFQDIAMQTLQTHLPSLIETVVPGGAPVAGIVMMGLMAVLKGVFGIESGKGGKENVGTSRKYACHVTQRKCDGVLFSGNCLERVV